MNKAITNDLNKQIDDMKQKISGLNNVSRLIGNTLSIIGDTEIKGGYAKVVAEIQDWLQGFDATIKGQIQALQSFLPKEDPKPIEIAVVPADATIPQESSETSTTPEILAEVK